MKVQVVRAEVEPEDREAYLRAWREWAGTLFAMGIRTELLESEGAEGRFVELTWLEDETMSALADDRLVRADAALGAAASKRSGELEFYARTELKP